MEFTIYEKTDVFQESYRFLKNISFSGIVNTMKIDLSIFMSCKAGFLLTISLFCQQEVRGKDILDMKHISIYNVKQL